MDSDEARTLIKQAKLENLFANYAEDVMAALEQAPKYNKAIGALDVEIRAPSASHTSKENR